MTWLGMPVLVRWLAPFAVMFCQWELSSRATSEAAPSLLPGVVHNGMHVVVYAVLAGFLLLALTSRVSMLQAGRPLRARALASVILTAAYGVVDEWHQSHVPGRVSSLGDLLSDASGATLGACLLLAWLCGDRCCRRALPWCALACCVSVSIATWLPW